MFFLEVVLDCAAIDRTAGWMGDFADDQKMTAGNSNRKSIYVQ